MEPDTARSSGPYQDLHERVSALSITESSRDGAVTVEVGADGTLRAVVLRDRDHPLDHYAATIMSCLSAAQARIPDMVERAVAGTVGANDPAAHLVLAGLRERFPQPVGQEKRRPRREVDESVDDWAGGQILEDV